MPQAHNNLAVALTGQGKFDEAVACFHRAMEIEAGVYRCLRQPGQRLEVAGDGMPEARRPTRSSAIEPRPGSVASQHRRDLPGGLREQRGDRRVSGWTACAGRRAWRKGKFNVDVSQLGESAAEPPFNLLYHGRDDRPIKEAWARLFRNLPIQETAQPIPASQTRPGGDPEP